MQEFQPLCRQLLGVEIDPRQIAARPRETRDKAKPDWVFADDEDSGDCRGCCLGRERHCWASGRDDHCDLSVNQFGRQLRQSVDLILGPAVFDGRVLALDVADLLYALAELAHAVRQPVRRPAVEKSDHRHRRLLRARRERPRRRRAAEQCDERASFHSISASARTKNVSGIVRPMALAVLRLTANSNFVGCSMGKSFGCQPCNILCTNFALWRNKAGPSAPYDIRPPVSTKPREVEAAGKRCSSARSAMRLVDKLP